MTKKFFVYGTLKLGGRFAGGFDSVRKSSQVAKLKGFDLYGIGSNGMAGFPGIVPGEGTVIGELHEYGEEQLKAVLARMDMIEGYTGDPKSSLYMREKAVVELEDGTETEAYVYTYNQEIREGFPLHKDGVWEI